MIIIDTIYINSSGGKTLLLFLIKELEKAATNIFFLIDKRLKNENIISKYKNIKFIYLKGSEINRLRFYIQHKKYLSQVFCLSNIPPPIELNCPVYTYFHNVLLFDKNVQTYFPRRDVLLLRMKSSYIKKISKNTKQWFVQTPLVKDLLMSSLDLSSNSVKIIPFYMEQYNTNLTHCKLKEFFYPAIGAPHKNHNFLFDVWENMYNMGITPILHVTIDTTIYRQLGRKILSLSNKGVPIINHGYLDEHQVQKLYQKYEYIIHPSLGESFGLVLIEAIMNGNTLLAPNLPYVRAIVHPHYYFEMNIESLKKAIVSALENTEKLESQILIKNELPQLLKKILI